MSNRPTVKRLRKLLKIVEECQEEARKTANDHTVILLGAAANAITLAIGKARE